MALSPWERNATWPAARTYTRELAQVAGTVMAADAPPAGLPLPWFAQIVLDPNLDPRATDGSALANLPASKASRNK